MEHSAMSREIKQSFQHQLNIFKSCIDFQNQSISLRKMISFFRFHPLSCKKKNNFQISLGVERNNEIIFLRLRKKRSSQSLDFSCFSRLKSVCLMIIVLKRDNENNNFHATRRKFCQIMRVTRCPSKKLGSLGSQVVAFCAPITRL